MVACVHVSFFCFQSVSRQTPDMQIEIYTPLVPTPLTYGPECAVRVQSGSTQAHGLICIDSITEHLHVYVGAYYTPVHVCAYIKI